MKDLIALEDVLFVFGAWTLMIKSNYIASIKPGVELDLLNQDGERIGTARVGKFLSSRNPEISAIEIGVLSHAEDPKKVKYVRVV